MCVSSSLWLVVWSHSLNNILRNSFSIVSFSVVTEQAVWVWHPGEITVAVWTTATVESLWAKITQIGFISVEIFAMNLSTVETDSVRAGNSRDDCSKNYWENGEIHYRFCLQNKKKLVVKNLLFPYKHFLTCWCPIRRAPSSVQFSVYKLEH